MTSFPRLRDRHCTNDWLSPVPDPYERGGPRGSVDDDDGPPSLGAQHRVEEEEAYHREMFDATTGMAAERRAGDASPASSRRETSSTSGGSSSHRHERTTASLDHGSRLSLDSVLAKTGLPRVGSSLGVASHRRVLATTAPPHAASGTSAVADDDDNTSAAGPTKQLLQSLRRSSFQAFHAVGEALTSVAAAAAEEPRRSSYPLPGERRGGSGDGGVAKVAPGRFVVGGNNGGDGRPPAQVDGSSSTVDVVVGRKAIWTEEEVVRRVLWEGERRRTARLGMVGSVTPRSIGE